MNKKTVIIAIAIFFMILLAFVLRLFPIRIAHWWDETVYLQHAEIMFSGRDNFNELSFRPPLLSILFFFGFFINHSVITASLIVAFLGALSPLFVFLIGNKIYGLKTGLIAGSILTVSPFIALNSNYILTDVPVITFLAISFYLILFKENKVCIFFSGVFLSFAILMKFTAALMIVVFLFYFLLNRFKMRDILVFFIGAGLIMLPYLIWSQISLENFMEPFILGSEMVTDKNEPTLYYFKNIPKAFTFLIPIGLTFLLLDILIQIKNKKIKIMKIDFVFILWILIFLIYLTKVSHKELRYILPISIPVILLASNGFSKLFDKIKKPYEILVWVTFIIYLIFLTQTTYAWENITKGNFIDREITDEMKISDYLINEMNYSGKIYTNQRWPVFAYYTGLKTEILIPYDERFYEQYTSLMKEHGILIGMKNVKIPQPSWLNEKQEFKYVHSIGDFFIYEYIPEEQLSQ